MTVEELLSALNQHAEQRGLPVVSKRALQDWIQMGLVSNAVGKGKGRSRGIDWRYNDDALRRGCLLIDLGEFGRLRFERARLYLWVRGFDVPADQVRLSLKGEFGSLVNRLLRASRVDYDARTGRMLDPEEIQAHAKRLGPLDPQLRASGFVVGNELLMKLVSELVFGGDNNEHKGTPSKIIDVFRQIGASSLFGNADEVAQSGIESLRAIQLADLELARASYIEILRLLDAVLGILISDQDDTVAAALKKVRLSLSHPDWVVCIVGAFAVLEYKAKILSELRSEFGWLPEFGDVAR